MSGASLCQAVRACFTTEMLEATALGDDCAAGAAAGAAISVRAGEIVPTAADVAASTTTVGIAITQRVNESIPLESGRFSKRVSERYTLVQHAIRAADPPGS